MSATDAILQPINEPFLKERGIKLFIKREDLIHPTVSGNKWRKLKYNLIEAQQQGHDTLLTFGGAYSNHIYATAAAAKEVGLKSIGVIRGDEILPLNDTLSFAKDQGMKLHYVDRSSYKDKSSEGFIESLIEVFGQFYLIPEGGSNNLAVKGCTEIIDDIDIDYDLVCTAVGTGGTIAGLIATENRTADVLGFSALKGDFLKDEVSKLLSKYNYKSKDDWEINNNYHFGGYAKIKPELINFINAFYERHQIVLDPIYTGKMMFGIYDLIQQGSIEAGNTVIALHTGGLQGIAGIEKRYGVKLPTLST